MKSLKPLTPEQQRLVQQYVPLAFHLARQRASYLRSVGFSVDIESLLSDAQFALLRAAQAFNPSRGYAFMSLAYKCVQNSLCRYRRRESLFPTPAGESFAPSVSLFSAIRFKGDRDEELLDPASRALAAETELENRAFAEHALADLTDVQRDIVLAPFVEQLDGDQPMRPATDGELAERYGRSKGWVARTRKEALAIIRAKCELQAA